MKLMFGRKGTHSTKKRSIDSERDLAAKLKGGKTQVASGALPSVYMKGDVKSDRFLADDKLCSAASFTVSLKLWKKLAREAWANEKRPLLRINFEGGEPLYILDEISFLELTRGK